jgi:hypothetical protein
LRSPTPSAKKLPKIREKIQTGSRHEAFKVKICVSGGICYNSPVIADCEGDFGFEESQPKIDVWWLCCIK